MSQLLVVTFKDQTTAGQAAERLNEAKRGGAIDIKDIAIVEKDEHDKVHVKSHVAQGTAVGAGVGGFLGLLIGLVFFPIGGLAIGAIVGGLIGHSLGDYVDKNLVTDVTADLTPGTSAIFVLLEGSPAALVGTLSGLGGTIYQTSLDPELEEQVEDSMKRGA
jgi:uncharacterized membrane protein